jgi:hypothetical protein
MQTIFALAEIGAATHKERAFQASSPKKLPATFRGGHFFLPPMAGPCSASPKGDSRGSLRPQATLNLHLVQILLGIFRYIAEK